MLRLWKERTETFGHPGCASTCTKKFKTVIMKNFTIANVAVVSEFKCDASFDDPKPSAPEAFTSDSLKKNIARNAESEKNELKFTLLQEFDYCKCYSCFCMKMCCIC